MVFMIIFVFVCLFFFVMWYRFWDIYWFFIGNEYSVIDVEIKIVFFNCSFYLVVDIFGNFCVFYVNYNLVFFGVICFNVLKVYFNSM